MMLPQLWELRNTKKMFHKEMSGRMGQNELDLVIRYSDIVRISKILSIIPISLLMVNPFGYPKSYMEHLLEPVGFRSKSIHFGIELKHFFVSKFPPTNSATVLER